MTKATKDITPEPEPQSEDNPLPTSNDVGKQTLTKADLGYDVTEEGTPEDAAAIVSPEHPGDPSAHSESEYNK